jgi:hypothetical protein
VLSLIVDPYPSPGRTELSEIERLRSKQVARLATDSRLYWEDAPLAARLVTDQTHHLRFSLYGLGLLLAGMTLFIAQRHEWHHSHRRQAMLSILFFVLGLAIASVRHTVDLRTATMTLEHSITCFFGLPLLRSSSSVEAWREVKVVEDSDLSDDADDSTLGYEVHIVFEDDESTELSYAFREKDAEALATIIRELLAASELGDSAFPLESSEDAFPPLPSLKELPSGEQPQSETLLDRRSRAETEQRCPFRRPS